MPRKNKPVRPAKTKAQPEQPPCTCPSWQTWTEQQRRAFGDMPVKFRDCPRHDA